MGIHLGFWMIGVLNSIKLVERFEFYCFEMERDTAWQRLLHLIRREVTRGHAEFEQAPKVGGTREDIHCVYVQT